LKKKVFFGLLIFSLTVFLTACGSNPTTSGNGGEAPSENNGKNNAKEADKKEAAAFDYPTKRLDWTIAFGPGGGNDLMARTFINILKKYELYDQEIIPTNRKGGSGAVGWGYVNSHKGDAYHISTTSGSFITTPLKSDIGFNYKSFTPIALMATDDSVLVVPKDSPYNTLDEFIEGAKKKKISIGGSGVAGVDFIITSQLGEEIGVDFDYVPFQSAGERTTALLSGTTDANFSFTAEVIGLIEGGEMKALAFTGQSRIPSLPDIPTMIEEGYDVSVPMPRGVVLPADVPVEVKEWWINTMKKVAETPEWKEYIEKSYLTEYILYGDDFANYLDKTSKKFEKFLKAAGAI
jgi:putative tricarboxylic transport membrane protein